MELETETRRDAPPRESRRGDGGKIVDRDVKPAKKPDGPREDRRG